MAKTASQIRQEINNFYLAIQNEITDVSTGSVAGGLIYSFSRSLSSLYDELDRLEQQAYIATASGSYLDLLLEGGFDLERIGATRSVGYVLVYGNEPISDPASVEEGLVCADYDYETNQFISNIEGATKFNGTNSRGSRRVSYALIRPQNSTYYRRDSQNRILLDLKGRQVKYLLLPVASILTGSQVNVKEGSLGTFSSPPKGLEYVSNTSNPSTIILNSSGISNAPLYSRVTNSLGYDSLSFSVINAFNFSSSGFLEVSYKASSPGFLARGVYRNSIGEEVSSGLVFNYVNKTQSSITLGDSGVSYIKNYENNEIVTYNLSSFTYNNVTYSVDASDIWTSNATVNLASGKLISGSDTVETSAVFFADFFDTDDWVISQRRDQISDDIIFDPDSVLTTSYSLKEEYRLSSARDNMTDEEYRSYFSRYINSLPRGTRSSLEFAALQVPGISFAKMVPQEETPIGSAVLLASSQNGQLSPALKQSVVDSLEQDWVSAGVNLIVTAPDLVEVLMSMSVTVTDESLKNSVKNNIESAISTYLNSKNPGDEIRYGEVYSIISRVGGVKNVSSLIIGKVSPDHYLDYKNNYSVNALSRLNSFSSESYVTSINPAFRDVRNEIIISSDYSNGAYVVPITSANYLNYLSSENIFRSDLSDSSLTSLERIEQDGFGAVEGIFSSDGGASIVSSNYSVTFYSNDFSSLSSDNQLRFSFLTSDPNAIISLNVNGVSLVSSDVVHRRVITQALPVTSTDVNITFTSDGSSTLSGIQSFLHDYTFDSYYVSSVGSLESLDIFDSSRINIIYNASSSSSRFTDLSFIYSSDSRDELKSFFGSLMKVKTLSGFQSIIRDYQYGTNFSGLNVSGYSELFSDPTDSDDFKNFLIYVTTAPLLTNFDDIYPLTPELARNQDVFDYQLTYREISRIHLNVVKPGTSITNFVGIKIL